MNINSFDQQAHRFDEVFVVEKRLAHSHEDYIDPVLWWRDLLVSQDRTNLADDLAGRQVAFDSQKSGETEPAIDGATNLTGDADRSSIPRPGWCRLISGFAPIAGFASVSFRHPDCFHGFAIGRLHQVSHCAIRGLEFAVDGRPSNRNASHSQVLTQAGRQGRNLLDGGNPLTVNRLKKLLGSVGRLLQFFGEGEEFGQVASEQRVWSAVDHTI